MIIQRRSSVDVELYQRGYTPDKLLIATTQTSYINIHLYTKWFSEVIVLYETSTKIQLRYDGPAYINQDNCGAHDHRAVRELCA